MLKPVPNPPVAYKHLRALSTGLRWRRSTRLVIAFIAIAMLGTAFGWARGRAAANSFHWPAALTKIFASRTARTLSPPAPFAATSSSHGTLDPGNTISGTVFDSGGNPITDGRTIKLIQNGTVSGTTATSNGSGVYTFTGVTLASGDRIATFIDGASEKGVTVTLSGTSDIANFDLKASQLTVRTDNGGSPAITNTNLADADSSKDPDIPFTVASGTLTTTAGTSLQINFGSSYAPGGNINDGGHWLNNGTFTAGANTVTFNGAAAQTIGGSNPTSFATLTINPSNAAVVSLGTSGPSTTSVATALNLSSGVFSQGETGTADFSLTTNSVTVASGATWRNLGKGDLTLSGNVSNSGTINFNANGSSCEELATNDIAITSTGVARIWSGTGTFSMTDVDVQNQTAGTGVVPVPAVIIVNSGHDSGGNTRWTFTNTCSGPYTWVGGANQSWIVPTNWSPVWPNAAAPTTADILLIDGDVTPGPTITSVPAQTDAALRLVHGGSFTGDVTLQASGANTLTLNGGTPQGDLLVEAGGRLVLDGSAALTIDLSTSGTGNVNGQIILQGGAHKIISGGLANLKFFNNSIFTTGPGFSGNPFGLTGVARSVQFQNGSSAFFNSGGNPFGQASPNGIVSFDFNSTETFSAISAFSYDARTYGNLVLSGGVTYAPSASNPLEVFGDLTIDPSTTFTLPNTSGALLSLAKNFTDNGTFNSNGQIVAFNGSSLLGGAVQTVTKSAGAETFGQLSIGKTEGAVRLGSEMTINGLLQFAGTGSAVDVLELNSNDLNLNGTVGSANSNSGLKGDSSGSHLNIGGTGALGTVRFISGSELLTRLVMNRAGSATFGTNLTIGNAGTGNLTLTNGTIDMGSNTLALAAFPGITRTGGYVIGNLQKTFAAMGSFTFQVGTLNGYSQVDANVTAGTFPSTLTVKAVQGTQPNITRADKALSRYWTLTESGDLTADLTFHYLDPTDIPATANESSFIIQKYEAGFTQPGGSVDANANAATISGVMSFSDWTLADPSTSVVSLNRSTTNPTNSATVTWQIVFADPVNGLTASNFALVNTGLGGTPGISSVAAAGTPPSATWNISASTGTGQGTLGLNMVNDGGVTHAITNLAFTGQVFNIDHVAPSTTSFTRQVPLTQNTSDDTLVFRATFNEDVTGVDTADFAVSGTTATATSVTPVSGSVYDVTVSGGDLAGYNGVVGLNFSGSENITDIAGNALPNTEPAIDETYTVNNCPAITLSPSVLPGGVVGVAYSQAITASPSGPSYSFTVTSGALPDGLTLTTAGLLQGTPTAPGPFNFTVTATDNNSCQGSQVYTVNINTCPPGFGVNSTDDTSDANPGDGVCETVTGNSVCTLRAAIQEVNALGSVCAPLTIGFAFPDTLVHTISPATPLPIVTQPVFINGYSQTGSSVNTQTGSTNDAIILIELTGGAAGAGADGIVLSGGSSTVDGLVINRFDGSGVKVTGAGTANNNVTGNFIGTDVTGLLAVDGSSVPFGNRVGVLVDDVQSTMIGCTTADERNIISANLEDGVRITGANASQNLVWGNLIGTDKSGSALGNGGVGVSIIDGSDNSIGIDLNGAGKGNTIASNTGVGVLVKTLTAAPTIGNIISQNSIHDNGGLGIDLGGDGVTLNDPGDVDPLTGSAPNNLQNFPENLVVASAADGIVYVNGDLNSAATKTYRVDLYGNSVCNAVSPNDYGEGRTYLGSVTPDVTTDGSGHSSFSFTFSTASFPGVAVVTATATDTSTGDTSEFSQCAPVVAVAAPTISIDSVNQSEGNSGPTNFNFTVSLNHAYPEQVTVQYQTQDNTATAPSDYAAITTTTLTFNPGETSKPVTVVVNGDTTFEANETFFVNLSNPSSNASIGTGQGVGTISNDDAAPSLAIDSVAHNEGNGAGTTSYVFTVTKTGATALSSSVQFQTQDGTATLADSDYQANSGTLNFGPTDTTKQITVLVNHDDKFENNEAFTVHLFGESGATIGTADGTGTITNDDAMPSFAIDSVAHNEGNGAGTTSYVFTVTKTGATAFSSSVQFQTQDGTATLADSDYQANSGTLNFGPTDTTRQITVLVNHDDKFENNEAFTVHLFGESGATIGTADGTGTITNDDAMPSLAIDSVEHNEGNTPDTTSYVFTVTKTGPTALSSSVQFQTQDGTATLANNDYQANSGTLNFGPTDTTKQITVLVNGDNKLEPNETFTVHLFGASGATISTADGTGTLTNDDADIAVSVSPSSALEDEHGNPLINDVMVYTFTRTGITSGAITVNFSVGGSATFPSDYTQTGAASFGPSSGTVTFGDGVTTAMVTIDPVTDAVYETNETVILTVTPGTNYGPADTPNNSATGTIINDDPKPTLAIGDRIAFEGTVTVSSPTPTTNFVFTVTRTGSTQVTATVDFATADGTTNPATGGGACAPGIDYVSQTGTLTFLPNQSSKTITIAVCKDAVVEANETFFVELDPNTVSEATIAHGEGKGTIQNDDSPGTVLTVNTTDDINDGLCDSHCTLREAITLLNGSPGPEAVAINFAIPATDARHFYYKDDGIANHVTNDLSHVLVTTALNDASLPADKDPDWPHGWWSILPTSPVPAITHRAVVDGSTQTGWVANTLTAADNAVLTIELSGQNSGSGAGLTLSSGTSSVQGLVINRFAGHGLDIQGGTGTSVVGNFIGTDVSGTLNSLGNTGSGISTTGNSLTIGGPALLSVDPVSGINLISGNNGDGVAFSNSNGVMALGNLIGTKANGTSGLGNSGSGISFAGAGSVFNTIGGTQPSDGNTIAFNGTDGVRLPTGVGVGIAIRGNSIFSNGSTANDLGIDLGADGVATNDTKDPDTGPNNLQNFPIITSALVTGSTRTITGTLNSTVGDTFTIDFYQSPSCDTSGNGEGKTYLGTMTTAATDAGGDVSFIFHPAVLTIGQVVTATATSTGASFSTSEFSACFAVSDGSPGAGDIQFTSSTYSVGEAGGTASITVQRVGGTNGSITSTFSTSNGTAQAPGDYTAVTNFPITYADGETGTKTVTVSIVDDTIFEGSETVNLSLSHPRVINAPEPDGAAILADPYSAVLTITDNDPAPTFTINDVSHNEGNSGTTAYTFTVTKTGSTALNASVDYATVNGTATAPSDFTAISATTLTFLPADTTKQFTVLVNGDTTVEPDEAFTVHLSNPVNATISDADGAAAITNDDTDVSVAVSPASVAEDGVANLVYTFTRNGITSGALTINFSVGGTATFATDYTQSGADTFGATSGTVTFGAGNTTATVTIDPTPDVLFEPNETVILTVTSGTGYNVASPSAATGTINNDDAAGGIIRFSSATYNTTESSGVATITVQRVGDTAAAATVDYATPDDSDATTVTPCAAISGSASPRCDFTTAVGTLRWAAGDGAAKTFNVLISQDNYVEGPETLTLTLSNLTGGAVFGVPSTATLTIADDATEPAANPIDDASNFVRQHYHDFLNREPDSGGLAFWTNEITSCGSNQQCIDFKRVQVSAAFYISIEFQDTGYLVERLYKASYGDGNGISTFGGSHTLKVPIVRFSEFLPDTQEIGLGVVVGAPGWPQALENNKVAFVDKFVQRARFTTAYANTLTPAQFVDALFANAGVVPTSADRQAAIDEFGGAGTSANTAARGRALRRVAENSTLTQQEFNRAFVLMQYFGYLRRNPNSAPDTNYTGFDFWLTKLNQFNGNFQNADMVKSFLVSGEYRNRAGR